MSPQLNANRIGISFLCRLRVVRHAATAFVQNAIEIDAIKIVRQANIRMAQVAGWVTPVA